MLLEGYRETWREFSGLASDNARKLGFAGIATIWVFRTESASKTIPGPLLLPALLIVVALAFDLLQYTVSAAIYGAYQRILERRGIVEDQEIAGHPTWFNWPSLFFLWGKLILTVCAYVGLISFLWRAVV